MHALRRVGLVILSLAAVAISLLMGPEPPEDGSANLSPTNYVTLIDLAMSDYEANDARTETAPQQQVVNGWVARDLLQIQARQLADVLDALTVETEGGSMAAPADERVPALLVIAILVIAWTGITAEAPPSRQPAPDRMATEEL